MNRLTSNSVASSLKPVTDEEWNQDLLNSVFNPPNIADFVKGEREPTPAEANEPEPESEVVVPTTKSTSTRKRKAPVVKAPTENQSAAKKGAAASSIVKAEPVAPPRPIKEEQISLSESAVPRPQELHLVFKHANVIGFLFAGMKRVCENFPLKFTRKGLLIRFFDSAQVAIYEVWIPADKACLVYDVPLLDFQISLPVLPFKTRKDQFVEKKTMTFSMPCTGPKSNEMLIKLFPATGDKSGGIVSTFPMSVGKDIVESFDDYEPDDVFQYEITISRELLVVVFKMLDKNEKVKMTIADSQFIIIGNFSASKREERHEIPIGTPNEGTSVVEYVMKPKSERCVVKRMPSTTPREPVVDLCVSSLYFSNSIYAAEKAGYFKICVGRMSDGRFAPFCLRAYLPDGCTFTTYIGTEIGDEEEQAMYSKAIEEKRLRDDARKKQQEIAVSTPQIK
jgi:hypothetical protein